MQSYPLDAATTAAGGGERVMIIRFVLKSGATFTVECCEFSLKKDERGRTMCECDGVTKNKPLYIDFDCVAAILQERL